MPAGAESWASRAASGARWDGTSSLLLGLAVAAPLLITTTSVPDSVFYNQWLAWTAWAAWLTWSFANRGAGESIGDRGALVPAALMMGLLLICTLCHGAAGPRWAEAGVVALALLLLVEGGRNGAADFPAWCWSWWVAGLGCSAIAVVQYFVPAWADGGWIASNTSPGRAIGNMRQPNHLATAVLCALTMTGWLGCTRRLAVWVVVVSSVVMVFAVALSASRTGALALGLVMWWALWDRHMPRAQRWAFALSPLVYLAFWASLSTFASIEHSLFYGAERLRADGDISSSRFAIWRNALSMIVQQPWTGVGWGGFNFGWTFSPFADRPVAFFDHTHNIVLQLLAEIGVPATAAVMLLLVLTLRRASSAWRPADDAHCSRYAASLTMLAVVALHSLLEYPLWYAYFLLPAAWLLGVVSGGPNCGAAPPVRPDRRQVVGYLLLGGSVVAVAAAYLAWDHRRIEAIFLSPADAAPLERRIAEGQRSVLFGHHADYAAVTSLRLDQTLASFRRPLHQLVDVRLLIAYIDALKAKGRDAEALYAAQRLREFRRDDAQAYFAHCPGHDSLPPLECQTRPSALTWRDLEP